MIVKKNLGVLWAMCSVISLGACAEKTKTKEVVRAETPWYQQASNFQKDVYGDAVQLPHSKTNCLQTTPEYLSAAGVNNILVGQRDSTVYDILYDVNDDLQVFAQKVGSVQQLEAAPQDLEVCNPAGNSDNLEGVAAYAVSDIKAAANWYQNVTGTALPKLSLQVHPLSTITTYARYSDTAKAKILRADPRANIAPSLIKEDLVDNAYWTIEGDTTIIAVMPHTTAASAYELGSPRALWELPFVVRHEYGHHVFYHSMQDVMDSSEVSLQEVLAKNPRHQSTRKIVDRLGKMVEAASSMPMVDTLFLLDAVNEGFADLYAFYASGETMPGIEDAPCFIETRDVATPQMAGVQAQKIFTTDLLDALFNHNSVVQSLQPADDASCNAFAIDDPHMVGAVIAHVVDQVFAAAPAVQGAPDKAIAKTQLALQWLDRLNTNLALAENGPALILAQIMEEAVLAANGEESELVGKSALCRKVRTYLPGFKARWKQHETLAFCFASP